MNEKTPNLQFQAAMKEARAMAIKWVPELAESAGGVESFPIGHKASVDDETRTGVPTVHDPVGGRTQGRGTLKKASTNLVLAFSGGNSLVRLRPPSRL